MNQNKYDATEETQLIIDELLDDGSDPDAIYLIEHHISSSNFTLLEKFAVEAFKLGFEATDPEELPSEELISCDIVSELPLNAELINEQIIKLVNLAAELGVNYDGWGTYFEDGSDDDYEYDEEWEEEEEETNSIH